ncbi:MAG TPA: carboxypeptidase regulatory-like domain-containing protein [Bacteroidetes bacterium]|nr:carboxypeptidase regulatory-like domain-containing protein [Bacteroidota bacterium]
MKKSGILFLLFLFAFAACRKNIDEVTTIEDPYEPPIVHWTPQTRPVNGSVFGIVADASGTPVAGADVQLGNLTTTTDDYGHFAFNNVTLDARGTVVKVEKAGYFNGSRRFFAVEDQTNRIRIELIEKSFDYAFNATSGGYVETPDGASITFSPNSIAQADGSPYTGEVKVAAKWLDPTNVRTLDLMPGNLQGINRMALETALTTYGMMAVELQGANGEQLNIANGNTATLSMPVPTALQGNAPAEIPLWSYNEEHGVWVEEQFAATLTNGAYVGEVTHFSFWNCDFPGDLVEFQLVLIDESGDPLSYYGVSISLPNSFGSGWGYTCPDGSLAGLIPANEELSLTIYGQCGEALYTQTIGPFTDDVDLGTIAVPVSVLSQTTISGTLIDCDGDPVLNGLVIIEFDGHHITEPVSDGTFDVSFSTCNNTPDVVLTGVNLDAAEQSTPLTAPANTTTDVGQVSACGIQLQNFITITVDDGSGPATVTYTPALIRVDSTPAGIIRVNINFQDSTISGNTSFVYFGFSTLSPSAGDYSDNNYVEIIYDDALSWSLTDNTATGFDSFIVEEFGTFGEPVIGTFEGTLTNTAVQPPQQVAVSGTFNIIWQ